MLGELGRSGNVALANFATKSFDFVRIQMLGVVQRVAMLLLALVALELSVLDPNLERHFGHAVHIGNVNRKVNQKFTDKRKLATTITTDEQRGDLVGLQGRVRTRHFTRVDWNRRRRRR